MEAILDQIEYKECDSHNSHFFLFLFKCKRLVDSKFIVKQTDVKILIDL